MNKTYDAEREQTPYGRFEIICERYIHGTQAQKDIILNSLTKEEQVVFLLGAGLYHLFTDSAFYNATEKALAEVMCKEFREKQPIMPNKIFLCEQCAKEETRFSEREECQYQLIEAPSLPCATGRNPKCKCEKCGRAGVGTWYSWLKKELYDD